MSENWREEASSRSRTATPPKPDWGLQRQKLSGCNPSRSQIGALPDAKLLKSQIPEEEKRWLHIDDDTGVLLQYNQEKAIIDVWRTRKGTTRVAEEVALYSFLKGVASDAFYNQIEFLCDGIVDLKKEEKGREIEHYLRLRIMRGKRYDSRWHLLKLTDNGEVTVAD